MKVAVLCDPQGITAWQSRALNRIADDHELIWLLAQSDRRPHRKLKYALYYLLNILSIRNRLSRRTQAHLSHFTCENSQKFEPEWAGNWAVLPDKTIDWLKRQGVGAVLRFGLDLIRVSNDCPPILSYHHGDPREFRGRPAGFYETLAGVPLLGQVVQVLSNELDGGTVIAYAETRVHPYSYRKTMIEAYELSPFLLPPALAAIESGGCALRVADGPPAYRLPNNRVVLRFLVRLAKNWARRILYGAFVEKRWNTSVLEILQKQSTIEALPGVELRADEWRTLQVARPFAFYADGFFFGESNSLIMEGFHRFSANGQLVILEQGKNERPIVAEGHVSYPFNFSEGGRTLILPEVVNWSRPCLFEIVNDHLRKVIELDIDTCGLIDPTLLRLNGQIYLFGNRIEDGSSVLHLWIARSVFGRFEQHPASPIRISARGSRMAGEVISHEGNFYRFGQDCRNEYGDGILAFRIIRLTPHEYEETAETEMSFSHVHGPHTVNRRENNLLFDWYVHQLSFFAGTRRILHRFRARSKRLSGPQTPERDLHPRRRPDCTT